MVEGVGFTPLRSFEFFSSVFEVDSFQLRFINI